MTRQEMFNLIVKKKWNNEILGKYGRPYSSCSNDILAAFIEEKQKGSSVQEKSEQAKKEKEEKQKPKTQDEILREILARVDSYKASTEELRNNTDKLDSYTKLLEKVKRCKSFIITCSERYDEGDVIKTENAKMVFEDSEFVRELLICFITERINSLMDSIEKTQNKMKAV